MVQNVPSDQKEEDKGRISENGIINIAIANDKDINGIIVDEGKGNGVVELNLEVKDVVDNVLPDRVINIKITSETIDLGTI